MILNSTRIRSVEYNDSTEVLTLDFFKGGKYKYYSVPETIYNGIIKSASPGAYFDANIKMKYNYKKA